MSIDRGVDKMWYIYTVEYYSVIERNKIGSFVEMWMDLESVIQSKVSHKIYAIIKLPKFFISSGIQAPGP